MQSIADFTETVPPMALRPTGRTIPDVTRLEHVCEYQGRVTPQEAWDEYKAAGNGHSPDAPIVSIEGKWGYSNNEENYSGSYDTREEAVQEAEASGYGHFWVGQFKAPITDEAIDAEDLLEKITCQDDYCGDWTEDALDCSNEVKDELTESVRRVFREWMDRHGLRPTFGIVYDAEEIVCEGPSS
jgi:hypothetical protein